MAATEREFEFIDWIRRRVKAHPRLAIGIGDDTASLAGFGEAEVLVTVDMLMEGVHFTFPETSPQEAGRKLLAVNLSDIAAMAGRPLAAVVSAAFPKSRGVEFAQEFHAGLQELADEFGVAIIGGDTNVWNGPLVASLTLFGEASSPGPVRRNGALIGDWIMTTGDFGGSLTGKHIHFQPRVAEALRLQDEVSLHAMIDVSDGLSADLHHVLDESNVGAVLFAEKIPVSEAARQGNDGRSALEHALSDGEDFELLFTVSPDDGIRLISAQPLGVRVTQIGEITGEPGCTLCDEAGNLQPLVASGWVHGL